MAVHHCRHGPPVPAAQSVIVLSVLGTLDIIADQQTLAQQPLDSLFRITFQSTIIDPFARTHFSQDLALDRADLDLAIQMCGQSQPASFTR